MKSKFSLIVLPIILISVFFILSVPAEAPVSEESNEVRAVIVGGERVEVELAQTPVEHAQGLSGKSGLPEGTGMLFVFPESGIFSFWMKDMKFAIDIIWLDENLEIVYIKEEATPASYPQTFGPDIPAKYVLEVPAGFSKEYNLKIGDSVKFE